MTELRLRSESNGISCCFGSSFSMRSPVAAGFETGGQQCAFGGIADDFPRPVFLDEMRVVAAEENGRQFEQRRRVLRFRLLALEAHFAVRPVAFAGDFVALAGDVERAHGHFADGQGAGLVRADDRRRAERLDRGQFAHQRAAAGHAQHAERERHRDDGRQPFRHGGHGETDRGHEQLEGFRPAQQPQPEQQRDDAQRRPDEDASERVEFLLQRGLLLRTRLFNQTGDAAQLRVHRRGHDHGLAGARRDAGAHEHHVLAVAERDVALLQSRGLLRHRLRLAGQRGLDAPERGRLQEPGIGRDQVAGFQREDVAGDDSRGGNRSDLPVAPHLGLGRGQLLERRDGLLGLEFLVEADDRVEDDDGEDGDAVHHFTEEAGDDTGGDENPDDEALELAEEHLQRADGLAFLQLVRAVGREPLRRFLRRESIRRGSKLGQHLLSRLAVPGFALWLFGDGGCLVMRTCAVGSISSSD